MRILSTRVPRLALWAVLLALLLRAYVPAGFMPSGTPGLLMLCPEGLPAALLGPGHAHHHPGTGAIHPGTGEHHPGDSSTLGSCPFGSAPPAAPLPALLALSPPAPLELTPLQHAVPLVGDLRPSRAHRARAPPLRVPLLVQSG